MLADLMDILACPEDYAPLTLEVTQQEGDDIVAGTLTCTVCGEVYPIEDSIPNLLPKELRAAQG
jgi:uncharacterized protein YbaR (Trm112 family)